MIRITIAITSILLFLSPARAVAETSQTSIRRMVLVVGANNGGPGRVTLRYAGTDASRVATLTEELGGVSPTDIVRINDSKLSSLREALNAMQAKLAGAKAPGVRVEFLFYYSGHSDESGLLLSGQRYSYSELRSRVEAMPAEVKIAILDSCASGAFTRTKGGKRRPAFLVDESSRVNGYALIASSSATELSQESDRIASSFFTHYFVSGLRGGADSNRDGRVTLNEAYQYAFDETVSRTESTQAGAQHPAYNMHLAGTGDVVMTDLRSTRASLVVGKNIVGRLFIRDAKGNLVIELTKKQRHPMTLGVAPDTYSIVLLANGKLSRASLVLRNGKPVTLSASSFVEFEGEQTVTRGSHPTDTEEKPPVTHQYFGASLLPAISTSSNRVRRNVSLNLLGGSIAELHGFEISPGVNNVSNSVHGLQIAGILNSSQGPVRGVQLAGIANMNTDTIGGLQIGGIANHSQNFTKGAQIAGISNYSGGFLGTQVGGIGNYARGNADGLQIAGVVNVAKGNAKGLQVAGIANVAGSVHGVQISPVNVSTGAVRGFQIGVVNVAKESDVAIGIINIVENGYRSLETWTSDTAPISLGFKMGARRTYTLFSLSQSFSGKPQIGLGLGVHTPLQGYFVDFDIHASNRISVWEDTKEDENDILAKARLTLGWQIRPGLSLIGGVTFNTTHAFEKEGTERGLVHKTYRSDNYVLRYGPGAFLGASWNLGK